MMMMLWTLGAIFHFEGVRFWGDKWIVYENVYNKDILWFWLMTTKEILIYDAQLKIPIFEAESLE